MSGKLGLSQSPGEGRETHTLLGPLERTNLIEVQCLWLGLCKGPNGICVSLPSPGDGYRSTSRNVVFSSCI
jgi:hypothetical protein